MIRLWRRLFNKRRDRVNDLIAKALLTARRHQAARDLAVCFMVANVTEDTDAREALAEYCRARVKLDDEVSHETEAD